MIRNQALNLLYLKTGLVTAIVAVVVALQIDLQWAAHYAAAGLLGLINWYLLGVMLISWTQGEKGKALGALAGKMLILTVFSVMVLPFTGLRPFPFLLGFNMFLLIALLEVLGTLVVQWQQKRPGARPLPPTIKALLTGRPHV